MTAIRIALLALVLVSTLSLSGQGVPDSFDPTVLKDALEKAKDDSVKLEIMLRIAESYRLEQPEKANKYSDEVIDLANAQGLHVISSNAFLMKAIVAQANSRMDSSLFYMNEAISSSEKTTDTALQIMLLNNKALLLGEVGRAYESAEILAKTIRFAKASKDTVNVVQGVTYLANIRGATEDFQGTLELIQKEKPYWENTDEVVKAKLIFVRANCYSGLEEYEKAKADYEAIYETFKQVPSPYNYVMLLNNYANALLKTNNALKALVLTDEAIVVAESINLKYGIGQAFLNKAMCLYNLEAIDSARVYADSALHVLNPTEAPSLYLLTLQTAQDISVAQGNWKIANGYNKLYIHLKDSLDKVARAMSMDSLIVTKEVEEKEAALLTAQQEANLEKQKRQRLWIAMSVCILLVFAGGMFYKRRKQHQLKSIELQRDQKEQELKMAREELRFKLNEISVAQGSIVELEERVKLMKTQQKTTKEKLSSADIFNILKRNIKEEADWTLFEEYFANANPQFLANLKTKHSLLSAYDLRLLSLLRLNLNNNEIATLYNIAPNSVRKARGRMAQKLGLEGEKDLHGYLMRSM